MEAMRAASHALEWVGVGTGSERLRPATDLMTFWFLTPAPWQYNLTTRGLFDLTSGEKLPPVW
jgi:hypothetical protein